MVEIGDLRMKVLGKEMLVWREDISLDGGVILISVGDLEEKWVIFVFLLFLREFVKCRVKGVSFVLEGVIVFVMFMVVKDIVMYF